MPRNYTRSEIPSKSSVAVALCLFFLFCFFLTPSVSSGLSSWWHDTELLQTRIARQLHKKQISTTHNDGSSQQSQIIICSSSTWASRLHLPQFTLLKRRRGGGGRGEIANGITCYLLCLCCQADGREREEIRWLSEVRESVWKRERDFFTDTKASTSASGRKHNSKPDELMLSNPYWNTHIHTLSLSIPVSWAKQSLGMLPSIRTLSISTTLCWWIFYFYLHPVIMTLRLRLKLKN